MPFQWGLIELRNVVLETKGKENFFIKQQKLCLCSIVLWKVELVSNEVDTNLSYF